MRSFVRRACPVLVAAGALASGGFTVASSVADGGTPQWLPGGGAFVIGDGNDTSGSPVEFWGAQWWKDNQISGGPASPDFKGFALSFDLSHCTFTTVTGNSAPPPAGPLPPVMYVLVTTSVTESGSTVTGTISGYDVVDTDPGYGPDPGHRGTGTAEGQFVPCGSAQ